MAPGRWALHRAAARAELAKVRRLLERNPSLASKFDDQLRTPLHHVAAGTSMPASREAIAAMLLAAAPHLAAAVDARGQTALHRAADGGTLGLVRLLLAAAPAAILIPDFDGNLPLHLAAALRGRAAIVAALLATAPWAAGTTNSLGETPLFKAAAVDEESALLLLAEAPGAATSRTSPNVWMRRQWSPLIAAAHAGMPRLVAALLAAAPEAAMLGDANGDLPLHWASQFGTTPAHAEARRLLLQAAPQAALVQDKDGDTPLMCAAIEGNGAAVAQLLAAAPEAAGVRNKRGELPIQAALTPKALQRWGDDAEAARLLVHAGDAGDVAAALGVAAVTPSHEDRTATAAKLLIPELVAHRALTAAQWAALPAELPGLLGALPAVLARSEAEAARLMAHLPEPMRAHIQAAMLALARVQHRSHVSVPIVALQHIVSLAVAPSGRR